MNQRKHLTLIAAGAAFLASLPLVNVFEEYTWAIRSFLVLAVMCGVALVVRSLRVPAWAPSAAMAVSALFALTWLYPSGREWVGILPSPGTLSHFGSLLSTASTEMSEFATPVGDRPGFLFLATFGVALVGLVVDLFAVVLRRPALAGLPMLAIYSVPVTVTPDSTHWLPFALGALGFLWLLVTDNVDRVRRFGRRFTGDGRDVDLWEPSPLAAAGQRLGAVGIFFAVLLPLLPFAMPPGMINELGGSGGGGGGIGPGGGGRQVSMFALLSGQLTRDKAFEMLKVTNQGDPNPFYLRFNVLEQLTSQGFNAKQITGGQQVNAGLPGPAWNPSVKTNTYKATIEVTNELAIYFLPIYTWPAKIDKVDNNWSFDRNTGVVYSGKETTAKKKYTVEYTTPVITPEDLRNAPVVPDNDPALAAVRTAPPNKVVADKVAELTKDKTTEYDKVKAIWDYFTPANGFVYDTSTGADTSGTKIADFLQNKRGYCAQYAAAFGWLLREAKIPARVAFGFARGGTKSGQTMTLTNFNLHAWTEVYFPNYGWLPFDATPSASIGGSVQVPYLQSADAGNDNGDDKLPHGGPNGAPSDGPGVTPGSDQGNNPGNTSGPANTATTESTWHVLAYDVAPSAAGGLLVLLLLASPALTRRRTRTRRLHAAVRPAAAPTGADAPPGVMALVPDEGAANLARSEAHRAWDELVDTMIDYHVTTDDAETPRATVARLVTREQLRDEARTGVELISTFEEHARYARTPLTGRELRTALQAVRAAFAARASSRTRFMATVFPPSVLRRWRSAISQSTGTAALALGRVSDKVTRALSVRRFVTRSR